MPTIDQQCEKFMGGPFVPHAERLHITIDQKGKIFLNRKAHRMIGRALAVYLYFNRPKNMIILEKTDCLTATNAFQLKEFGDKASAGRAIYANPFCKHFIIRPTGTLRFLNPEVDAAGRMYLKLHETVNVSRGPRKGR